MIKRLSDLAPEEQTPGFIKSMIIEHIKTCGEVEENNAITVVCDADCMSAKEAGKYSFRPYGYTNDFKWPI